MTDLSEMLHLIACPECEAPLESSCLARGSYPVPFDSVNGLRCTDCHRTFPVVDGVLVLWSDSLKRATLAAEREGLSDDEEVLSANIKIYDTISADYEEHSDKLFSYHDTLLFLKALAIDRSGRGPARGRVWVDVGCGPGVGLDAGAGFADFNIGIDVSLANLRSIAAKGRFAILADASHLPLRSGSIDAVSAFAALHHFPSPASFACESYRILREGGALVTGADPSAALLNFGPLAALAWRARKPVYRLVNRFTGGAYLHADRERQRLNDLAENHRTQGGFSSDSLHAKLHQAGFRAPSVFHGLDPSGAKRFAVPEPKVAALKLLSFRNPFRAAGWMSISTLSVK